MSESASAINARQDAARIAQAAGAVADSKSTAPKSDAPKSAGRKSTAPKSSTVRKSTAPKSTGRKSATPKSTAPNATELKRIVAAFALKSAVDAWVKLPKKTVKGSKFVTVNGQDIPLDVAQYAIKQVFGYIPPAVWDKRLGIRDVGRPVSTKSAA